jgi:hypothetical protein
VSPRPSRRLTIGSRSNPPTCSLHPLSFICGTLGLLGGAACCCLVLLCPPMRIQTQHKHTRIYTYVDWKKTKREKLFNFVTLIDV